MSLHDVLKSCDVGCEILQIRGILPRSRLFGERAWFVNNLIVLHLVTGIPYPRIVEDQSFLQLINRHTGPGQFQFCLHLGLIREYVDAHACPTQLEAYEALLGKFLAEERTIRTNYGHMSSADYFRICSMISRTLWTGSTRHRLPWTRHSVIDENAYMWWFLTMSPPGHENHSIAEIVAYVTENVPYINILCIAACSQMRVHIHGIFQVSIPVSQKYIDDKASMHGLLTCEPIRTSISACYEYIENQRISQFVGWPDDGALAKIVRSVCPIQERVLGITYRPPWKETILSSIRQGVPWYTIKGYPGIPFYVRNTRSGFRRLSHEVQSRMLRTWIPLLFDDFSTQANTILAINATFGKNAFFNYSRGFEKWTGQPVIVCHGQAEKNACWTRLTRDRRKVAAVLVT
jgi:hypothetical protein